MNKFLKSSIWLGLLIILVIFLFLSCGKENITQPQSESDNNDSNDSRELRYKTKHFKINYPTSNDSSIAFEIAGYCESVYDYVNTIYNGCAPDSQIDVYLSEEQGNYSTAGGTKPDGIYLYLNNKAHMKQIFAHEVSHTIFYYITNGRVNKYHFINEGISVIIERYYELELGRPEPREMRAYWAEYKGVINKDELSDWNLKFDDLSNVFYAVGYTFNTYFRKMHGVEKWVDFIIGLSRSYDLGSAFQNVGLSYDSFYDEWISYLTEGANTNQAQLSRIPVITDSLIIEPNNNDTRNVKVKITVQNGENNSYGVSFSFYLNNNHSEHDFQANSAYFEKIAVLGENLTPGTEIKYNVVTWSNILESWIKSGWKIFTLD